MNYNSFVSINTTLWTDSHTKTIKNQFQYHNSWFASSNQNSYGQGTKEEEIKVYRIVYQNFKNQNILNFAHKSTKLGTII